MAATSRVTEREGNNNARKPLERAHVRLVTLCKEADRYRGVIEEHQGAIDKMIASRIVYCNILQWLEMKIEGVRKEVMKAEQELLSLGVPFTEEEEN